MKKDKGIGNIMLKDLVFSVKFIIFALSIK